LNFWQSVISDKITSEMKKPLRQKNEQKKKTRNAKGEISFCDENGKIRLRWTYKSEPYSILSHLKYNRKNFTLAEPTAKIIKAEMTLGSFDKSLQKYRDILRIAGTENVSEVNTLTSSDEKCLPLVIKPVSTAETFPGEETPEVFRLVSDLSIRFIEWATTRRQIVLINSPSYTHLSNAIKQWDVPIDRIVEKMAAANWCPKVYNERLNSLKHFFDWLVNIKKIETNPLFGVMGKKVIKDKNSPISKNRLPIKPAHARDVLEAVRTDKYCTAPRAKHSFYYPFLAFFFYTGARNAEGIGLRVKNVNFAKKKIRIEEVLARTTRGRNHKSRVRKGTKNGTTRELPMCEELAEILLPLCQGRDGEELVFLSSRGLCINDYMFIRNVLRPVMLKVLGEKRDLYALRHTIATRAMEQGYGLNDIAYILGDTIETCLRNYVHIENPPETMPSVF
jgi:integrase